MIITKNEADNIKRCLESAYFADEIIVLDSGSTDQTLTIAKQFTSSVYESDWPGFGAQKNRAIDLCHSEWILSLDADEVISPELAQEIQHITKQNPKDVDAYLIPRKSNYCNKWIAFGDWRHDYCLRLFKRGRARFKDVAIHEDLIVTGDIRKVDGLLLHHSFSNFEQVLNKINSYSTLTAQLKYAQGKKSSLLKAVIHGCWTFFRGYFLKLGFLDGRKGFMLAVSNAEGCYYRYIKMIMLDETKR